MANSIDSRSLELSWDPPDTSSTEFVLTGYTIICNGSQVGISVSASTTNLVINNLMPYTTYKCTVDTNFAGNNIARSTPVTETTLEEGTINGIDMYDLVLNMLYIVGNVEQLVMQRTF